MNPGFAERTVDPFTVLLVVSAVIVWLITPIIYLGVALKREGLLNRTHRLYPDCQIGPSAGLETPTARERTRFRLHLAISWAMVLLPLLCFMVWTEFGEKGI